jgi:hypothetical protein
MELSTVKTKNSDRLDFELNSQLSEKDGVISRQSFEINSLKNNLRMLQEEASYHEESSKRLNTDIFTLRGEIQ